MKSLVVFLISISVGTFALATLKIPNQLNYSDRKNLAEILGYGSLVKIIADPYPLGGYSGFEVSLSQEYISTDEIARAGSGTSVEQSQTSYLQFNFGKGLYNNIDVFFNFTPLGQSEKIAIAGGQVRYLFYQAPYFPAHLSLNFFVNHARFNGQIVSQANGMDILAGFNAEDFSFYMGSGLTNVTVEFLGGANGLTDDLKDHRIELFKPRFFAGFSTKFSNFFLAAELDRVVYPTYSGKLGFRF